MTVDGIYNCEVKSLMGKLPVKIALTTAGAVLNASCSTKWGDQTVVGTVSSDNKIAFSSLVNSPLGEVLLEVDAKIEGDNITGRVKAGKLGSAPLKGQRIG